MANNPRTSITIPLSKDIRDALNKVAGARHQSAANFVRGLLESKINNLLPLIGKMREIEARIQVAYDSDDENGQESIRRSPSTDARKAPAKNRRNTQG
jgi:hypothetical protein